MQISQCWLLIAFYNPECINSKWLDIGQVPFLEVKEEEKKSRSIKRGRGDRRGPILGHIYRTNNNLVRCNQLVYYMAVNKACTKWTVGQI